VLLCRVLVQSFGVSCVGVVGPHVVGTSLIVDIGVCP